MNVSSKIFAIGIFTAVTVTDVSAQISVTVNKQMSFGKNVPAGNYSGITGMGNGLYAVVSDKSEYDGYFVFNIDIDSISGEIINVRKALWHRMFRTVMRKASHIFRNATLYSLLENETAESWNMTL